MKKVRLGKTEMMLTKIGFGGIPIQRLTKKDGTELIKYAVDSGINWIDTANSYGISEEVIGNAVETYDRSKIYIFTKSLARDRETLKKHIHNSLDKLHTSYIDLFFMHYVSDMENLNKIKDNGIVEYLVEMKNKGIIRHIGVSSHNKETLLKIMEFEEIESVQFPFNFVMEDYSLDVVKKAKKLDQGFIAMKPFGGGIFDDASICIPFFYQYPDMVLNPGFEKSREIKEVIDLSRQRNQLTEHEKKRIDLIKKQTSTKFCRRCGYCEPCENGVQIVTIMNIDTFIKRFPREKIIGSSRVAREIQSYENCIECGICETKCPYELPIIIKIKEGIKKYKRAIQ